MKITDASIIKTGEQELIDGITADLDWGAVEEIFKKEHNLNIDEDIEFESGDIIALDKKIVYQLKFHVRVGLSILLDREGNYKWERTYGGDGTELGYSIAVNDHGVFVVGRFNDIVDFGGGAKTARMDDMFVLWLDHEGDYQWDYTVGPEVHGHDVAVDSNGRVMVLSPERIQARSLFLITRS